MLPTNSKLNQPSGNFLIFYNNRAGKGSQEKEVRRIKKAFNSHQVKHKLVNLDDFNWQRVISGYQEKKLKAIVVAGGDGSLRTSTEIMRRLGIKLPVGFIPLGSTNWVARSLGIPLSIEGSVKTIIRGNQVEIDAGIINDKHIFLLAACFGKIAKVSISPSRNEKSKLGLWAYFKQTPLLFKYYPKINFEVKSKKGKEITSAHSLMIVNHLNLHNLKPQRNIHYNDGKLHYFVMKNKTWKGLVQVAFEFYFKTRDSCMLEYKEMTELTITKHNFMDLAHIDGDELTIDKGPIKIKVIPSYVSIFK